MVSLGTDGFLLEYLVGLLVVDGFVDIASFFITPTGVFSLFKV